MEPSIPAGQSRRSAQGTHYTNPGVEEDVEGREGIARGCSTRVWDGKHGRRTGSRENKPEDIKNVKNAPLLGDGAGERLP